MKSKIKYAFVTKNHYLGKVLPATGPRIAWTEDPELAVLVVKKFMSGELPIVDGTNISDADADNLSIRINVLTSVKDGFQNIDWFPK